MPKKTPTLVQITPRPTSSHRIENPDDAPSQRRLDCRHYDACLDVAVDNDWRGFHCNDCKAYEKQSPADAKRDYFATLNFLAETQLLAALRASSFKTSTLPNDHDDQTDDATDQPATGFEDESCAR